MTKKLKTTTSAGEFTRATNVPYTHVVVWNSPRATTAYARRNDPTFHHSGRGVHARWIKDRGYAVTWHGSERAAQSAAHKGYGWDAAATPIGIFPVAA